MKNQLLATSLLAISLLAQPLVSYAGMVEAKTAIEQKDYATAFREFKVLAENGNAEAQLELAKMYDTGKGVTKNFNLGFFWITKSAESGLLEAQNILAKIYENGIEKDNVDKDYNKSLKWYTKAAEQGDAKAQCVLGQKYFDGKIVNANYKQSFYWCNRSAEQNSACGERCIAAHYYLGRGVTQDDKQAFTWTKKSAEHGDSKSEYILATLYENGKGTEKNLKTALSWYDKSSDPEANVIMGIRYFLGKDVLQNYKKAFDKLFVNSIFHADADAFYVLGIMFSDGLGTDVSYSLAHKYFNLATYYGKKEAAELRNKVEAKMTNEQLNEAQKDAQETLELYEKLGVK